MLGTLQIKAIVLRSSQFIRNTLQWWTLGKENSPFYRTFFSYMKPSPSCRQNQHCNLWLMGERGKFATLTKESGCLKHFVAYSEITAKQSWAWLLKRHARQYYRHERKVREAEERIPVFLTFEIAPKVDKNNTFDKKNRSRFCEWNAKHANK